MISQAMYRQTESSHLKFVGSLALVGMSLMGSGLCQDGLSASAKQRKSLEPLVESVARRLELHIPCVEASAVEYKVRKALANQRTSVAKDNLAGLIRDLVMEDRDLGRPDRDRVDVEICKKLGRSLPTLAVELVPAGPEAKPGEDAKFLLVGFASEHAACLRHRGMEGIKARNGEPLELPLKKGMEELADYYSGIFALTFGVDSPPRDFKDLLTGALAVRSTRQARLSVVGKLRFLLRPGIYKELKAKTLEDKLDAELLVEERIRDTLTDSALWERLRLDHEAMLKDPKAMRRDLKDRKRP
ncbi:MAG: hypothetical protein QF848_06330 [Planctomycetota bacterium]|nr:hypothetical protein [Planctomycetota bacterium]